jgi:cysteinyl-tRNA synthetase
VPGEPGHGAPANFIAALEDDLNTPMALAELFELAREAHVAPARDKPRIKAQFVAAAGLLGLLQQPSEAWFKWTPAGEGVDEAAIQRRVDARTAAKKARDFKEADRIRDELAKQGVILEDVPGGTRWKLG